MDKRVFSPVLLVFALCLLVFCSSGNSTPGRAEDSPDLKSKDKIVLPAPKTSGNMSLEEALLKRRSVRVFSDRVPTSEQVGQLLWAAQGINRPDEKRRTNPSAFGLYPLQIHVVLPGGIYHYLPEQHELILVKKHEKNKNETLLDAGYNEGPLHEATCVFFITTKPEEMVQKCKSIENCGEEEAWRYIYLEGGHVAQSILLEAVALGMGGVPIGAPISEHAMQVLGIPTTQKAVYIIATGFPE